MSGRAPDYLHLGCGLTSPAAWLNVDGSLQVVLARWPRTRKLLRTCGVLSAEQAGTPWSPSVLRLDLTRPLPFPDERFHAVYSSHLLEHLYHDEALALLKEARRVLRRGGVCRAVVPDLGALVERYIEAKSHDEPDAAGRFMDGLMVHARIRHRGLRGLYYRMTALHQHKWMYDADSLAAMFEAAGFNDVRRRGYLESAIDRIHEVEEPGRICEGQGVAVEATKA